MVKYYCQNCGGECKGIGLCIGCGSSDIKEYNSQRDFFIDCMNDKSCNKTWLLSRIECNNKLGSYTDLINNLRK